ERLRVARSPSPRRLTTCAGRLRRSGSRPVVRHEEATAWKGQAARLLLEPGLAPAFGSTARTTRWTIARDDALHGSGSRQGASSMRAHDRWRGTGPGRD